MNLKAAALFTAVGMAEIAAGGAILGSALGLTRGCTEGQKNLFLPKKEIVVRDCRDLDRYGFEIEIDECFRPLYRDTFEITTKPAILTPFGMEVEERCIGLGPNINANPLLDYLCTNDNNAKQKVKIPLTWNNIKNEILRLRDNSHKKYFFEYCGIDNETKSKYKFGEKLWLTPHINFLNYDISESNIIPKDSLYNKIHIRKSGLFKGLYFDRYNDTILINNKEASLELKALAKNAFNRLVKEEKILRLK